MLPNRFPDAGETPEYNTYRCHVLVFRSGPCFLHYTGDYTFVGGHLYDVLADIVDWHVRGTRYGIHMDVTAHRIERSWCAAYLDGREDRRHVVTPRNGKPVEIQALWYNALRTWKKSQKHEPGRMISKSIPKWPIAFERVSMSCSGMKMRDVSTTPLTVMQRRDNQAKPDPGGSACITPCWKGKRTQCCRPRRTRVVDAVWPEESVANRQQVLRRYEGDPQARDSAYHQGRLGMAAWPFIDAYFKVNGTGKAVRDRVRKLLEVLSTHLNEAGLGHISKSLMAIGPIILVDASLRRGVSPKSCERRRKWSGG